MNAQKAKALGLTKVVSEFMPGDWVRVYWGNGDREHQYSRELTAETIKYLTEWPSKSSYYRKATPEEVKVGQIRKAVGILEDEATEFKTKGKVSDAPVNQAMEILKQILKK